MAVAKDGEGEHISHPWMEYLDEEIRDFEKGSIDENATIIIRDILAANEISEVTIKEAALRLDEYDKSVHLSYDPMETIVHAARLIPYDNALQDRLIQLLHELMETPTGPDYNDTLSGTLEKDWNDIFPNTQSLVEDEKTRADWKQKCDQWLNFSAFKARTLAAGICADNPDWSFKAPLKDISIGLGLRDDVWGDETFTDCMFMVATQHVLIAGEAVRSQFTKDEEEEDKEEKGSKIRLNQHLWKLWIDRFQETAIRETLKAETKIAAGEAHEKMITLWPEIFSDVGMEVKKETEDSGA